MGRLRLVVVVLFIGKPTVLYQVEFEITAPSLIASMFLYISLAHELRM